MKAQDSKRWRRRKHIAQRKRKVWRLAEDARARLLGLGSQRIPTLPQEPAHDGDQYFNVVKGEMHTYDGGRGVWTVGGHPV